MVDSGPFIFLERAGRSPRETLEELRAAAGSEDLSVSAIAYTELVYGIYRAESDIREAQRRQHLFEIFSAVTVEPYTRQVAEVAARIRGEQMRAGNTLPFADSLIAASAMSSAQPLLTQNLVDFQRIPRLQVIPFRMN